MHRLLPLPRADGPAATAAGIALVAGGVVFSLSDTRDRAAPPHHRGAAPAGHTLVITGPYLISRNPMYAGHVVACVGAALWAGSWWPLIVLPLSVLATHRLVIVPEEVYLGERYPDDCAAYRSRVRRWL